MNQEMQNKLLSKKQRSKISAQQRTMADQKRLEVKRDRFNQMLEAYDAANPNHQITYLEKERRQSYGRGADRCNGVTKICYGGSCASK